MVFTVTSSIASQLKFALKNPDTDQAVNARRYLRARLHEEMHGIPTFSDEARKILAEDLSRLSAGESGRMPSSSHIR